MNEEDKAIAIARASLAWLYRQDSEVARERAYRWDLRRWFRDELDIRWPMLCDFSEN